MKSTSYCGSTAVCWALVLLYCSFLLQLIGYVTPGWLVFLTNNWKIDIGLWYILACRDECRTYSMKEFLDTMFPGIAVNVEKDLLEFRVEGSVALAASILSATGISVACRFRNRSSFQWLLLGVSVLSFISGIISLIASGTMGDQTRAQHYMHMKLVNHSPFRFPYSVLLTGLGGIAACLASLALVVKFSHLRRQGTTKQTCNPVTYSANTNPDVCFRSPEPHSQSDTSATIDDCQMDNSIQSQSLDGTQCSGSTREFESDKAELCKMSPRHTKYSCFH